MHKQGRDFQTLVQPYLTFRVPSCMRAVIAPRSSAQRSHAQSKAKWARSSASLLRTRCVAALDALQFT